MRSGWKIAAFFAQSAALGLALAFVIVLAKPDLVSSTPATARPVASYAEAVAASAPAVVNIYTERNRRGQLGSGVVINQQGYVVTNWHVIRGAEQIRLQLASVLKAVLSQRLVPRSDGKGRVPAVEVLISTPYIRDCIVDKEKTHLIHGAIAQGTSQYGMQTFDQSIFTLFEQGYISYDEALRWASNVDEFKLRVQGISTTADLARNKMAAQPAPVAAVDVTRFGG